MVSPWRVTQAWGVYDPKTYSQFGFTRHNGIDVALGTGSIVNVPFDCVVARKGYEPNGGGIYVGVISTQEYDFDDGVRCKVLVDSLHLKQIIATEGEFLKQGQQVAIGDNTGVTTGPHTHFQFRRVSWDGKLITSLDKNDANNSFDPMPYFDDLVSPQIQQADTIVTAMDDLRKVETPQNKSFIEDLVQTLLTKFLALFK